MTIHFKFPFAIHGPFADTVDQGTLDEVAQSIQVILTTMRGSRIELPDFGVDDLTFSSSSSLTDALAAVRHWEPRATVTFADQPGTLDVLVREIITYAKLREGVV